MDKKITIVVKYDDGVIVQYKNVNSKLLKRGDKIQGGSIITVMLGGKNDEEGYVRYNSIRVFKWWNETR